MGEKENGKAGGGAVRRKVKDKYVTVYLFGEGAACCPKAVRRYGNR